MKPRIGRTIYTIYIDQISEETVKFLGKDSFIVANYDEYDASYEFYYDEYNINWFTSLSKAKTEIKKEFPDKKIKFRECKDIATHTKYWEATEQCVKN